MKIKDKIIKMFGGYTKQECDILEDKYKYIWMEQPNPTIIGSTEKQIHNIELIYAADPILCYDLRDEYTKKLAKNELKKGLIHKLEEDEFIGFKESDYEIKLLLQVVK